MSITHELREWWVRKFPVMDKELHEDFTAIADRIDAEHEEDLREAYAMGCEEGMGMANAKDAQAEYLRGRNDGYDEGWDAGFASADDWFAQHEDAMAEHGWVRLPKDADGEYIHIGDVMESKGSGLLFGEASFEVRSMRCDECGWEVYDRLGDRYAPSLLCHYHAPTVEDVLREFTDAILEWSGKSGTVAEVGTWSDVAAEYVAKLRLAGDAE